MLKRRGFTLVELIVVIAIVAIISAILFPIFAQAKSQAFQISWGESARQVALSTRLYVDDYDDTVMLPRHNLNAGADASNDRTWVQSLLPYTSNFEIFFCPIDKTRPAQTSIFDPDLSIGDPTARYYEQSQRTNLGYNYAYFAPIYRDGQNWKIAPRTISEIENPSGTLLFGDSAWKVKNGVASGGGNYLVIPPCRYQRQSATVVDTFVPSSSSNATVQLFENGLAWSTTSQLWRSEAGGLYPWFKKSLTITFLDGHVKQVPLPDVTAGCDVKENWQGFIVDSSRYIWDLK
ncbi:MAG: prepilin-type N-terminal cleavage/methylation domain-containing protein [Fimbriimonadaceae bacterium]